ncbi:sigma-54 interaction domain-containing protein [Pseudobacillus wudalianchiensis]|uniref:sigma-54 interaction domain-containing protein n=1 Tax=Pseudobacillus wudalianchiensis TaxID=1743143 RepID=UPI0009817C4F|nr:sigma 54-interacting transcriptional regulator [Bacillus wudalianchiensis]
MKIDVESFKGLSDFDNVLIVDANGIVIFYDLADLNVLKELDLRPENFLGKHITSFYKDLTNENSTLMNVLRSGVPLCNVKQEMTTNKGNTFVSVNSTYPIKEGDQIIGAVEFSKHFFDKKNIQHLDKYARHKVYRKNDTIYTIDDIITANPKMTAIKQKLEKISKTDSTVLIHGRTGTGKEVIAQAIHNLSDRYSHPFVSLNCGAVPANLLESTLFGTTKGSFTGSEDKPGLFEQAEGGTLFLDEINSLELSLQVKLLKAIEEKSIRRIGGKKNIRLDIRVISATNEDPDLLLSEKRMREDLYYRLGVVQLDLPSLKERQEDIEVLLQHYIEFYNNNMNIFIDEVDQEVIDCFKAYNWPGNIRELKNAVETAFNHASEHRITMEDIPRRIREYQMAAPVNPAMNSMISSLREAVEDYEKKIIENELEQTNGVIAQAARRLGLSKQSLKYKMDKYRLR